MSREQADAQVQAIREVRERVEQMGGWEAEADATYHELGTTPTTQTRTA